jgi:thiamine-monophosphate kinase
MDEFSLIKRYFTDLTPKRPDVLVGIGDDAASLFVPPDMQLLVSTDTLVAGVHFLNEWEPFDIAYRAVMVNVSDIAAMGASPSWVLLALTLPDCNEGWLKKFAEGFQTACQQFDLALVGGDTTKGPLSMTLAIHGVAKQPICRSGAQIGDAIYVSGELGAAALGISLLNSIEVDDADRCVMMSKLLHPSPRTDLGELLQAYATSAIDISDGLSADLNHICVKSSVGAMIELDAVPVHQLVKKYQGANAVEFAMKGGDDYELCFTIRAHDEPQFLLALALRGLSCYRIGQITASGVLSAKTLCGAEMLLKVEGYSHF